MKTIIVRNTAIMFALSVKKVESLQKYNYSVYSPTEKLAPVNNNTSPSLKFTTLIYLAKKNSYHSNNTAEFCKFR